MEPFSLFSHTEEDKMRILKELGFTETGMQEDVDAIMEWFQMQPHLVEAGIDMYQKEFRSEKTKQFLLKGCKEISDEKKRPGDSNNEEFLAGTFKKLDFD